MHVKKVLPCNPRIFHFPWPLSSARPILRPCRASLGGDNKAGGSSQYHDSFAELVLLISLAQRIRKYWLNRLSGKAKTGVFYIPLKGDGHDRLALLLTVARQHRQISVARQGRGKTNIRQCLYQSRTAGQFDALNDP